MSKCGSCSGTGKLSVKVSGRIDTLARVDGILEAVEFKSVHDKAFSYGDLPKKEHILQVGCYLTWPSEQFCRECEDGECQYWHGNGTDPSGTYSKWCKDHECQGRGRIYRLPDRGRLVYWSKNDARIEEYIVYNSEELSEQVKAEFSRLEAMYQRYLLDGTIPDPLPLTEKRVRGKSIRVTDWRIGYCKYMGTGNCCGDKGEIDAEVRSPDRSDSAEVSGLSEDDSGSA